MSENHNHDSATDGGVTTDAVTAEQNIDYLQTEVSLFNPNTPYMRDHIRIIWTGFIIWCFTTFGPVTATVLAPEVMTTTMPLLGFPFHYFAIAIGGPGGSLLLAAWYARKRDQLDEKYGIDHTTVQSDADRTTAVTDGGDVK